MSTLLKSDILSEPPPPSAALWPRVTKRDTILFAPGGDAFTNGRKLESLSEQERGEALPLPKLTSVQVEELRAILAALAEGEVSLAALMVRREQIRDSLPSLMAQERRLSTGDPAEAEALPGVRARLEASKNWLETTSRNREAELLADIERSRRDLTDLCSLLFPGYCFGSRAWSPPRWVEPGRGSVPELIAAIDGLLQGLQ
jgi:hypothetical protein